MEALSLKRISRRHEMWTWNVTRVTLQAHNLLCAGVSLPLRLFYCIWHHSESDSVGNRDFLRVIITARGTCNCLFIPEM